jgi:membrane protease YdiL (CAAX protease family)
MNDPLAEPPPAHLLPMAAAFEGAAALLALALGWLLGHPPLAMVVCTPSALLWGAAAALPPLLLLIPCVWFPVGPLRQLLRVIDEMLVPMFATCRGIDLAIISILAGIGEELLFRGVLQEASAALIGGTAGRYAAWIGTSILFGLAHWITPLYALLAGLIGLYLGWLLLFSGNLLLPIVAHAGYDFLVLVYLVRIRHRPRAK